MQQAAYKSALEVLKELVAIPSVNPFQVVYDDRETSYPRRPIPLGSETQINLYLEATLRDLGFRVERQVVTRSESALVNGQPLQVPERWNILATKHPQHQKKATRSLPTKSLLFLAHTDTVDVKHGWESDPFKIDVRRAGLTGERWYALGSNDMKGGIAAIVEAVSRAAPDDYTLKVAFVVDEEFYSFGAETLCQSEFLADVALALVPEIGDNVHDAERQWVGLGRLGRAEFEFEIVGKACHGADAFVREDAVNAVHEAALLEAEVVKYCRAKRRVFQSDGIEAINSAYISQHSGGAAMLSVPDQAAFVLDRTFVPDEGPETELQNLRALVQKLQSERILDPRAKISVRERPRPTPACRAYYFGHENPAIKYVLETTKLHSPKFNCGIGRSVADENRLALKGIPTVILGPFGAGSHTPEEWVDPASVQRVARIYADLIKGFSGFLGSMP